jgi:predicted molibdopterin-dependent oxidoreductase YjgC
VVGLATVFGAGGGTSSYAEIEDTDVIVLWGSNARDAHPIFFHHVLQGVRNGAKLYVVDPRRSSSAQFADLWLGLEVGTDVALSNTIAREIIHAELVNTAFVDRGTTGFAEYAESVEDWTLERGSQVTGIPVDAIRELAHAYARADRAQICWTLGITEHHNGVDNVLALINLALLCGHVGRWGAGLNPLRGQNNVQGGGDMGALPNKLPGFQDVEDPAARARFEAAWGATIPPHNGWHLTQMFDAMGRRELRGLFVIGENPAQSEADVPHSIELLRGLDHLVVLDIFLTKTAELADVVLPGSASWCEAEGTVTNSERRVQLVRKAIEPPGEARDDIAILLAIAAELGHEWTYGSTEEVWDELRSVSPMHAGMSYRRLAELGGIQWPCYSEDRLEPSYLHGRLWADDPADRGRLAPFSVVVDDPPVDVLDDEFPLRLTTGRRLDSFNTGVQTAGYRSPIRFGETIDVSPEDADRLGLHEGETVRITSRRGSVDAPVRLDVTLRPGLVFMTFHFPDEVETNLLTIEATDPKSGTAEFKAAAVRIAKIVSRVPAAAD